MSETEKLAGRVQPQQSVPAAQALGLGETGTSSRRKRMSSTIILSSEQLLQYQQAASLKEQEQKAKKIERNRQFSILTREKASRVQERLMKRKLAAKVIQRGWREKLSQIAWEKSRKNLAAHIILRTCLIFVNRSRVVKKTLAASKIKRVIRGYLVRRVTVKYRKFRQYSKWTQRQSELMFALILSWRVRTLMRSPAVRSCRSSLSDIHMMLTDSVESARKRLLDDGGPVLLESVDDLLTVENMILYVVQVLRFFPCIIL
jgi:hypothetical protein